MLSLFRRPTPHKMNEWRKQKKYGKIIKALLSKNPDTRAAAATVLQKVDPSHHYTDAATLDNVISTLVSVLSFCDSPEVLGPVVSALAHFHFDSTQPFAPVLLAFVNAKEKAAQDVIAKQGLARMLSVNDKKIAYEHCLATATAIKNGKGQSSEAVGVLLDQIANAFMIWGFEEESDLGDIVVSLGPAAAQRLAQYAETRPSGYKAHHDTHTFISFAQRIKEGKACGKEHLTRNCICTKCGKTFHDLDAECQCKNCHGIFHQWSGGLYQMFYYECERCGARRHKDE